ncbi:cation diffusion facilitator family transporter [Spirochaeta isovalerica]|uniref:Cation diffusion facilitator family transporter n=1 Tax=Spirochaeta isovalerica TaxID=150 RepID=A0A841R834_9SPIO|nr:cation diffusion facilitator family transporter [Spirochaeta isovalerica]MBB6481444.1 cation diffusion facilitator family transporter [Spirochaeta isovalerica]
MNKETIYIRRIALAAFFLNLVLASVKAWLAYTSGSSAIRASVIDSTADCVASLAVFLGILISTRKTSRFPLGLYKIENLISVIVSIFIFIAGYEIVRSLFLGMSPGEAHVGLIEVIIMSLSTLIVFLFGRYTLSRGRKNGSPTLIAEGKHRLVDTASSLIVVISTLLSYMGLTAVFGISIDKVAAAAVLVFIIRAGWELLTDGMKVLLDASIEPELLEQASEIIVKHGSVISLKSLMGRNAGRFRFLQAAVTLRERDLPAAHKVADELEAEIHKAIPRVERIIIHYEPEEKEHYCHAAPVLRESDRESGMFGDIEQFSFLFLKKGQDPRITDFVSDDADRRDNLGHSEVKQKGIVTAEWLAEQKVDCLWLEGENLSKGAEHALKNKGIEIKFFMNLREDMTD